MLELKLVYARQGNAMSNFALGRIRMDDRRKRPQSDLRMIACLRYIIALPRRLLGEKWSVIDNSHIKGIDAHDLPFSVCNARDHGTCPFQGPRNEYATPREKRCTLNWPLSVLILSKPENPLMYFHSHS